MEEKKKILLMYATHGTGHKAVACNIEDYLSKKEKYEIRQIDILDYNRKFLGDFTEKFYEFSMYHMPAVWHLIYRTTDNKVAGGISSKLLASCLNNKKLKKVIKDYNPDLIISTHFTSSSYISKLKKSGELDAHLISVVTDYKAHRVWLDSYKSEDALIVNSPEEKKNLVKKGIDPKIIKTFGIPVADKYTMSLYDKTALMKKFNLTGERPIILFYAGGGNGSTTNIPYLLSIIESKVDADVFFVCGKSQELKKKAENIIKRHDAKNVHVLGFITNGPEYMMVADFVITKPGGATITECLTFKKPMVLTKNAGGQETENYKFLTKRGYAINAPRQFKFKRTIKKLCESPNILDEMQKRLEDQNRENSMKKLNDLVEDILDE